MIDHYSLFGCQISVTNFILGGLKGYSLGKCKCALKNPPSLKIESKFIKYLHAQQINNTALLTKF